MKQDIEKTKVIFRKRNDKMNGKGLPTQFETIEELVEQRRGYKYLNKDRTSPYQNYKYDFRRRLVVDRLDEDINKDCGTGWNLATLDWILRDTNVLNKIIVEFEIPPEGKIVVPIDSRGKFRTDIIKKKRIWNPEELFPQLKDISKRLANYKSINLITAKVLPPKEKILNIMNQVGDQVWDQVGDQVWAQVWDQVWAQVGDQVWVQVRNQVWAQVGNQVWVQVGAQVRDQVRKQVGDQVWTQIWNQVWDQVKNQVGNQVWNQVWDQVWAIASFAIKLLFDLPYEHPVFDLIRLGVIVVNVNGKYKIFGKNGKYLGEI